MCASVCMHAQDLTQENILSFISNRTMVNKVSVKQRNIVEPDSIQGGNKVNENGLTEQDKYCTAGEQILHCRWCVWGVRKIYKKRKEKKIAHI